MIKNLLLFILACSLAFLGIDLIINDIDSMFVKWCKKYTIWRLNVLKDKVKSLMDNNLIIPMHIIRELELLDYFWGSLYED